MAIPQHQRTSPLVLDVHLRQPGQDAPPAPAPDAARWLSHSDSGYEAGELRPQPGLAATGDDSPPHDLTPLTEPTVSNKQKGDGVGADPAVNPAIGARHIGPPILNRNPVPRATSKAQ